MVLKIASFATSLSYGGPGVPGTDDYKRRLLYNAIARAQHRCTVFVQTQDLLNTAPFA